MDWFKIPDEVARKKSDEDKAWAWWYRQGKAESESKNPPPKSTNK